MMNTSGGENQRAQSPLCANSCGFYGSAHTRNMCSKCYRNTLMMEQRQAQETQPTLEDPPELRIKDITDVDKLCSLQSGKDLSAESSGSQTVTSNNDNKIFNTENILNNNVEKESSSSILEVQSSTLCLNNSSNTSLGLSLLMNESRSVPLSNKNGNSESNDIEELKSDLSEITKPIQNRCYQCNKRIGLLGFQCRCNYYFCGAHRHADGHDCSFDYKAFGRQQLSKANQRVVADKLNNRI